MKSIPTERIRDVLDLFNDALETERRARCAEGNASEEIAAWRNSAFAWHRAFEHGFTLMALELFRSYAQALEKKGEQENGR